jgi:hypothetical protein
MLGIGIFAYFIIGAVFADVALDDWREQPHIAIVIPGAIGFICFWPLLLALKITYKIFQKILA